MDSGGDNEGCCGISCLKFSLSLFNVLFFTTGLILVAVGLWDENSVDTIVGSSVDKKKAEMTAVTV